jgi:adenine-specific DNA-methyltransferase
MAQQFGQPIAQRELLDSLLDALATHLFREAKRLGLSLHDAQVERLCVSLLDSGVAAPDAARTPPQHLLRENAPFQESTSYSLEIHDYLHLVSQQMRKQLGQFVTPNAIVKYMLRASGWVEDANILDKRFADPACGSGVFLLEAVRVYLGALRRAGQPMETWYPRMVTQFIGLDLDPIACMYTRFNLGLVLAPAILLWAQEHPGSALPALPVHCLDTLQALAANLSAPSLFSYDHSAVTLRGSFDFVIGNPPYYKTGHLEQRLQNVFRESLYGHPNAYGLFLHAGLEMVRPGGVLGYIIPRSMLSGLYFKNLRRFVEKTAVLEEVTLMAARKKVFEDVLQGTMILVARRRPAEPALVRTAVVRSPADLRAGSLAPARVTQDKIVRQLNGLSVWFVSDSERTYRILDKIIGQHPLLSSRAVGCIAKTGTIVWNRVKPLLRVAPDDQCLPLVWATDVGRFAFSFASASATRPSYLARQASTQALLHHGLALLVQRVTADEQPHRLVACVPESFCAQHSTGYFVENHLNVVARVQAETGVDLYYLLAMLNSDVMEFFFRMMNGNTQVSATELNLMPVAQADRDAELIGLARCLQATASLEQRTALEDKLNQIVAELYGLDASELNCIQTTLREGQCDDTR